MITLLLGIYGSLLSAQTTTISGTILPASKTPENITIALTVGENQWKTSPDTNGYYQFGDVPVNRAVSLKLTHSGIAVNGVSTYDFVLGVRHILGINRFENPAHYIAADINRSGAITAFDLTQMRQLILGITEDFPNNGAWRFVEKSQLENLEVVQGEVDYMGNFTDVFTVEESPLTVDFIGIKIGDLSGNAIP